MLQASTKRNIRRLLPFGLIWLLMGWVFLFVESAASNSLNNLPVAAIQIDMEIFLFASIAIFCVGILMGYVEQNHWSKLFIHKNFVVRIFYKLLIYCTFISLIILVLFPIAASLELDVSPFDRQVWMRYAVYFGSFTHLSTLLQLTVSLLLSLFYLEISEFIGHGVLMNFFTGKYHMPVEEERIFMFLDMKASTTIAEKLGHVEYFKLLRAYYHCFTDAIIEYEGEIYQYVGDEIILSWNFEKDGRDRRCIDCFFAMRKKLWEKEAWFKEQFGLAPSFKAGIHFGKTTVGEIGSIKKDIMFTGDVLNATARIQGLCNDYEVDLIVSGDLIKALDLGQPYASRFLGEGALKGKRERKDIFTVTQRA